MWYNFSQMVFQEDLFLCPFVEGATDYVCSDKHVSRLQLRYVKNSIFNCCCYFRSKYQIVSLN